MQEDILVLPPAFKLNKDRAVYLAAALGGPLAGAYLIAENFNTLEQPGKAKIAWGIAIGVTVLLLSALFFIPAIQNVPHFIIPLAYGYAAMAVTQAYQGADLKAHKLNGGAYYSLWRAALAGLIGALVLVALIAGFILFVGGLPEPG